MDKKTYIIQVLETLKDDRIPGHGLLVLAKQGVLSNNILDILVKMLQEAIKETTDEVSKNKLIEAQNIFSQIKEAESQSRVLDEQDIVILEAQIANI